MDGSVQAPRSRIGCIGAVERFGIVGIDQEQVARLDAGKVRLVGVHQEAGAIVVHRQREMVRHGLMHVEARRPAESAGEIDALFIKRKIGQGFLLQPCDAHGHVLRWLKMQRREGRNNC